MFQILHQMYTGPMNKLCLLVLMPLLRESYRINTPFQQDRGNPFNSMLRFLPSAASSPKWRGLIKIPISDEKQLAINLTDQTVLFPLGAICYGLAFAIALEEANIES